jgi:DNA-binding transcriptional MerR regulator
MTGGEPLPERLYIESAGVVVRIKSYKNAPAPETLLPVIQDIYARYGIKPPEPTPSTDKESRPVIRVINGNLFASLTAEIAEPGQITEPIGTPEPAVETLAPVESAATIELPPVQAISPKRLMPPLIIEIEEVEQDEAVIPEAEFIPEAPFIPEVAWETVGSIAVSQPEEPLPEETLVEMPQSEEPLPEEARLPGEPPTEEPLTEEPSTEEPPLEESPADKPRRRSPAGKTAAAKQAPAKRGRKSLKQVAAEAILIEIPGDDILFSKQYYTMGEVSEMFRVNQSLLRFWETEFDILQPRKNKKGDRYFRPVDIKNLHLIYHLLRQKKYTIEGAKDFLKKNKKAEERFEVVNRLQEIKLFLLEWKAQL